MAKKIKVSELAEFDPSKYLDDDEAIADYVRLAIEDGDPGLLAAALGDVARARGMTQVAQAAGLHCCGSLRSRSTCCDRDMTWGCRGQLEGR